MSTIHHDPLTAYERELISSARDVAALVAAQEQIAREHDDRTGATDAEHQPFKYGWVVSSLKSVIRDLVTVIDRLEGTATPRQTEVRVGDVRYCRDYGQYTVTAIHDDDRTADVLIQDGRSEEAVWHLALIELDPVIIRG
jgi:hypothetical protein